MMTAELTKCLNPKCGYEKALTHWSSGGEVNWVACPMCRTFFDFGVAVPEKDEEFWKNVEKDTGFKLCVCNPKPLRLKGSPFTNCFSCGGYVV